VRSAYLFEIPMVEWFENGTQSVSRWLCMRLVGVKTIGQNG
jgi:hypothetical protein